MANPIQSTQSDETIGSLKPTATDLSSRQLREAWDAKIMDHALTSARTTSQSYLEAVKRELVDIASRQVNPLVAETRLKATLQNLGYRPEVGFPDASGRVPPATPGSMRDLSSSRRIQLIIDTNEKQARSLGQIAASESPEALMTDPAWELRRTGARKKPRGDWRRRWDEAGKACGWKGAAHTRMVALKTSPIWQKLAEGAGGYKDTIGAPYPPFAFGSGLAWVNFDWDDWEDLCKREGIPDGLEDIRNKARELKAAKTARGAAAVKATVRQTGGDEGNGGPVGASVSPILGDTKAKLPIHEVKSPSVGYKPSVISRDFAQTSVSEAMEAVLSGEKDVRKSASFVRECRSKASDASKKSGFDDSFAHSAQFSRLERECADANSRLDSAKRMLSEYDSRIGRIALPTDKAGQGPYDRAQRMVGAAARSVAKSAQEAVSAAVRASSAAGLELESVKAEIRSAKVAACENLMWQYKDEVEAFVNDRTIPWRDRSRVYACWNTMADIAESGDEARLERYLRHLSTLVPGIETKGAV